MTTHNQTQITTPSVKLVSPPSHDIEESIVYMARVSNPANQDNPATAPQLIRYLIEHQHWSPFEMHAVTMEIETSRAISAQILRHRSFSFQEFSQRYAAVAEGGVCLYAARRQDKKNRQSSIDDLPPTIQLEWMERQQKNWERAMEHYMWALEHGIAKECARMVLPLASKTRIYMAGTLRSWITYLMVRTQEDVQKEHRDIAMECLQIIERICPTTIDVLIKKGLVCRA